MTGKENNTSCAEFQKELPFMFESGGEIRHEHLTTCADCSSLVKDLQYIADQAKLLLPMHDPSPRVWNNIESSLAKDGLIAENNPQRGHNVAAQKKNNQSVKDNQYLRLGWAVAVAAVVLIAFIWIQNSKHPENSQILDSYTAAVQQDQQAGFTDQDDAQLLAGVENQEPSLKPMYAASLRDVNQYISDARATLAQDPTDDEAQMYLRQAYAQKAMLYRMGTSRSFNESSSGQ
jgi:hypothetical protein